jgi:hypothetical protein
MADASAKALSEKSASLPPPLAEIERARGQAGERDAAARLKASPSFDKAGRQAIAVSFRVAETT